MLWKEMIQEEREEGREEGRLEGITEVLKRYVHLATRASTVDEFEKLVKDSQGVQ